MGTARTGYRFRFCPPGEVKYGHAIEMGEGEEVLAIWRPYRNWFRMRISLWSMALSAAALQRMVASGRPLKGKPRG
jgi:hypothetical protein